MSIRRKVLGTLTGFVLHALAGSPVAGQDRVTRVQFEAGAGVLISTRALSGRPLGWARSKSAPLITGGVILRSGSILAFRVRGGAALTAGTVSLIRSGPGGGKSGGLNGGTLLALGEVLITLTGSRKAELALGIGARRYRFGQANCAGPCGGDPSDTGLTGSLSISLGTKLGGVNLGLAAGSLVSSYRGRAMFDLLLGVRARF